MNTTLIVLALIAVAAGAYFLLIKKGKIEDKDNDFIADVVEDKVDSIKKEVKRRTKNVKAEIGDVKKASKELLDQAVDVAEAVAGKPRKGRKAKAKVVSSGGGSGKVTKKKSTKSIKGKSPDKESND